MMSKEELNQLDKSELVDLVYDYWSQLKTQAENGMNDKENYMMEEFGRVKMTQVNKLRNMLHHKLNQEPQRPQRPQIRIIPECSTPKQR